ncbi:omega-6 fatty acid desaturase [Klebsormidium nitens]|uniref:Omega-6 fatty acid desaturase n=1 Tax=Klebsormidium nitens TaxID=105231 RepID=A0A1Y1IIA5_KLENI|nr:omega-6 fatty acid desaturase [Klebsormidium nitens]|eukprot:GAQ88456.1 omega-6 fatty acid desaturase [Klebsormidium nitens]
MQSTMAALSQRVNLGAGLARAVPQAQASCEGASPVRRWSHSNRRIDAVSAKGLGFHTSSSLQGAKLDSSPSGQRLRGPKAVRAIAAPIAAPDLSDPEERERLAKEYGFEQIGAPIPKGVTLRQVQNSLPPEVFEINELRSYSAVLLTACAVGASVWMIANSPWYLLPLVYAYTSAAWTGLFVIGHDCAHKCFSKNKLMEDIVGTLAFAPLLYPYEPWRFKHDRHHAKTNMLVEDTAWHPIVREDWEKFPGIAQLGMRLAMGPLRPWASIGHQILWHFDLRKFTASQQNRVKISLAAVTAFAAIAFPLIVAQAGIMGWVKFWLLPNLGFHFWMSTFTMVHHTAPHIPFKAAGEWDGAAAQLGGTVHCDYPRWVEILCHDINVHIPHHISQRIPWYNLRKANESLRANWGQYLNEAKWNKTLMKSILSVCHIYDEEKNYVAFDEGAKSEDPIFKVVRTVL